MSAAPPRRGSAREVTAAGQPTGACQVGLRWHRLCTRGEAGQPNQERTMMKRPCSSGSDAAVTARALDADVLASVEGGVLDDNMSNNDIDVGSNNNSNNGSRNTDSGNSTTKSNNEGNTTNSNNKKYSDNNYKSHNTYEGPVNSNNVTVEGPVVNNYEE
jgi:hypothetical protein